MPLTVGDDPFNPIAVRSGVVKEDMMAVEAKKPPVFDIRVLHPVLLALYPILGLFANNTETTPVSDLVRPGLVFSGGAIVTWLLLWVILRNRLQAGIAASVLVVASLTGWSLLEYCIGALAPFFDGLSHLTLSGGYAIISVILVGGFLRLFRTRAETKRMAAGIAVWAVVLLLAANTVFSAAWGQGAAYLAAGYLVLIAGILFAAVAYGGDYRAINQTANWFAGILILLAAANIVFHLPEREKPVPKPDNSMTSPGETAAAPASAPDIYFIALEGYARADVLARTYGYDNGPFLEAMKAKGFRVAAESRANYGFPLFSMASCLNMGFLQDLLSAGPPDGFSQAAGLYHHNKVYGFLKDKGYSLQVFAPGSELLEPRANVDVRLKPRRALSEFERVLAKTTTAAARGVQLLRHIRGDTPAALRAGFIRERVSYVAARLSSQAAQPSPAPRFIFAQLPVPEAPFVFDREGNLSELAASRYDRTGVFSGSLAEYKQCYVDQLIYTNSLIESIVNAILVNSARPSVIVIVSGTGPIIEMPDAGVPRPPVSDRFSNVTLAYFPPGMPGPSPELEGVVSLVNVFPITFNYLFGSELPLKPDTAFVSAAARPLDFTPIALTGD